MAANLSQARGAEEGADWRHILGFLIVYLVMLLDWRLASIHEHSPVVFWLLDLSKFVIIPGAVIWFLARSGRINASSLGFAIPRDTRQRRTLLVITGLCAILLPLVWLAPKPLPWPYLWSAVDLEFHIGKTIPKSGLPHYLALTYLALAPAITEEVIFRGLLYSIVSKWTRMAGIYVVTTAVLFASIHWELGSTVAENALIYGLVAGWLFVRYGSLWPLVIGHLVTDLLVFSSQQSG
jgi:membrane protease YdiL (CAAX protease family)